MWTRHNPNFADLSEEHVTASGVDVVVAGVAGVDHEAVDELHGLGTLTAQLARHHHLATLRPRLHDEAKDTIARTASEVGIVIMLRSD